jgi:hypothetical protein
MSQFIKCNLAARKVPVSGKRVLKVADLGLARDVRDFDYYRKRAAGKLPESLCHNNKTPLYDTTKCYVSLVPLNVTVTPCRL